MRRILKELLPVLLAAAPLLAQRPDGCSYGPGGSVERNSVSDDSRDRTLREAGYLNETSVRSALSDPNPALRSLAALKLGSLGAMKDLGVLSRMLSSERDPCARGSVSQALQSLLERHWVAKPEQTTRVRPFQACTASSPPILSLHLEQITPRNQYEYQGLRVRITIRNLTSETLPFLGFVDAAQLFSVSVFEPGGHRAKIPEKQACYYKKCDPTSDPTILADCTSHCFPGLLPLPPQEDVTMDWRVGEDFDMSTPGVYQVSLGAKLDYLNTMMCSNIASVTVK